METYELGQMIDGAAVIGEVHGSKSNTVFRVCVPSSWTDDEICQWLDRLSPLNGSLGWKIRKEGSLKTLNAPERVPCVDDQTISIQGPVHQQQEGRVHVLLVPHYGKQKRTRPIIRQHQNTDWCHLCGVRRSNLADVNYPENAEHQCDCTKYIRICSFCANTIYEVAKGNVADNLPEGEKGRRF